MSFWSGEKLEEQVTNCIVGQYDNGNIDCAAYTLHVGPEVFITPDHYEPKPSQNTKRLLGEKEAFNIPSGQFAFLVTDEIVNIPDSSIAFISMKAKTKFKGLVNISGFHVDPGYRGRLVFSVFNAGPMPINLQRGMPLFLMWLADLDRNTEKKKSNPPVTELDLSLLASIHGPIFSPQAISESVKAFKDDVNERIHGIETKVSNLKVAIGVVSTIVTAVVAGLLVYQLTKPVNEASTLKEQNSSMSSEKAISKSHGTDAKNIAVLPTKSKATSKSQ